MLQEIAQTIVEVEQSLDAVRRQLQRSPARVVLGLRPAAAVDPDRPLRAVLILDGYSDTMSVTLQVRMLSALCTALNTVNRWHSEA